MSTEFMIIVLSAAAAAASFAAFATLFLNREEKKVRYQNVIQKKRKALFDAAKEAQKNPGGAHGEDSLSAKESLAMLFKMQNMMGEMGEKIRTQMLQAGYRNPNAPIKFMMARTFLPLGLSAFALLLMTASDKEISGVTMIIVVMLCVAFGWFLPSILVKNQVQKRQQEINITFPDALDMMLICVQGGIGLEQTVDRVAEEIAEHSPTLAEELGILSAEMSMLNDRRAALSDFARRIGGHAKSFATALIQAEQYGTSVSQALRVMADELRDMRMQAAEQKAMALPPKLTVPMILFFLPALFIIILGPVGIQVSNM